MSPAFEISVLTVSMAPLLYFMVAKRFVPDPEASAERIAKSPRSVAIVWQPAISTSISAAFSFGSA